MIVFIAWDDAEGKPLQFQRTCPACQKPSVIGHGWRQRRADDVRHITIRIQRGLCNLCGGTITMLPEWIIPGGHYSWEARRQAGQVALEKKLAAERCIPEIADPERSVDPSTVRRWFQRRGESLVLGLWGLWQKWKILPPLPPPTLFAWDWRAASRILIAEVNSP